MTQKLLSSCKELLLILWMNERIDQLQGLDETRRVWCCIECAQHGGDVDLLPKLGTQLRFLSLLTEGSNAQLSIISIRNIMCLTCCQYYRQNKPRGAICYDHDRRWRGQLRVCWTRWYYCCCCCCSACCSVLLPAMSQWLRANQLFWTRCKCSIEIALVWRGWDSMQRLFLGFLIIPLRENIRQNIICEIFIELTEQ